MCLYRWHTIFIHIENSYMKTHYLDPNVKTGSEEDELIEVDRCTAEGADRTLVLRLANNKGEPGAWVKAWVWVTDQEAKEEA